MMVLGTNTRNIEQQIMEKVRIQTLGLVTAAGQVADFAPIVESAQAEIAKAIPQGVARDHYMVVITDGVPEFVPAPFLDPTWPEFAGGADPTGLTSSTAAMAACLAMSALTGKEVRVPEGFFQIDSIEVPTGARLSTAGIGRTVFLRTTTANTYAFHSTGSLGSSTALSADASEGASSVTTATNPGLAAGKFAVLTSTREPYVGGTGIRPDWDMQEVLSVSGSGPYTITFKGSLSRSFATADSAAIAELIPTRVELLDVDIAPSGSMQFQGVSLKYAVGSRVEGVRVQGFATRGVNLETSFRCTIRRGDFRNPTDVGSNGGRGINVSNGSKECRIYDVDGDGCRHLVSFTMGVSYNRVRDCQAHNSKGSSYDCHGTDCRHITFEDCWDFNAPGISFNAGNSSWGGDLYIEFIRCKAKGISGASTSAQFLATTGSHFAKFIECEAEYGYNGFLILNSNDCDVKDSIARHNVNHAIRYNGALRGDIESNKIVNAGSRWFNSALGSDLQRIRDNDAQGALDLATVGAGTVTRDNRYAA